MTASPKSPLRSQAPGGTVRGSLPYGERKIDRQRGVGHEGCFCQAGPLRDLYEGLYRAWTRPGVQLAGRAIRCCLRLYQESGPCRLDLMTMADTPADPLTVPTCSGCWTTSAPGRLMSSSSTRSTV